MPPIFDSYAIINEICTDIKEFFITYKIGRLKEECRFGRHNSARCVMAIIEWAGIKRIAMRSQCSLAGVIGKYNLYRARREAG